MYEVNDRFSYAKGYFAIFPKGFNRAVGAGTIHETDDYIIYFKENTPKEIERRFVKEYAEYYKEYMKKFIG